MTDPAAAVRVVHELHAAFNERDRDAMLGCLADDVVWHVEGDNPMAGTYRGREHLWAEHLEPLWASPARVADEEVRAHGEHIVALGAAVHDFGAGPQRWPVVEVFRVIDGRVAERWEFTSDRAELDRLLQRGCPADAEV